METPLSAPLFAGSLVLGMLLLLEVGRRLGLRRLAREGSSAGFGAVEGAVFALFGLLIAFTFSGAAERFNGRLGLVADEANAIGTAYLRVELLASDDQSAVRQLFRDYLDSRLATYRKLPDLDAAMAELKRSGEIQNRIWTRAIAATRKADAHPNAAMLLMPALNEMFDIVTTRTMSARTHPPAIIFYLLLLLGFGCALLAGHSMAGVTTWSWLHAGVFAVFVGLVVYVILDIEYPRMGLIRVTAFDNVLVELRESMK